jgi:RNA polymerase sigma-70 factor, ECF subfamily
MLGPHRELMQMHTTSLRQVSSGAFEAVILPLQPLLLKWATKLKRSSHEASDLVQDTLERALRRFKQFRPGTSASGWLFRIMKNLSVDDHRRTVRAPSRVRMDPQQLARASPEAPLADSGLSLQRLGQALVALEPSQRTVLELRFFQCRTYRDISADLGIPVRTVGSRLGRARKRLRAMLMQ